MDKRYQVFVSSTFTDLEDERKHVIQTLMEMDCIPAGMELFPAIDEEQWEFIKRIIDDCDYYLLIIGGRYGSLADDGLSYTEKEFDYAISKGLKVIVLVHENPGHLPVDKSELNPESRGKLTNFITKASDGRLRKTWASVKDLPGLVALSMTKTIKTYPAVGWVRANKLSNEASLQEIHGLRNENENLKIKLDKLSRYGDHYVEGLDLVGLDSDFHFTCIGNFSDSPFEHNFKRVGVRMSWSKIFFLISPFLMDGLSESDISIMIANNALRNLETSVYNEVVDSQDIKTIGIQLMAYGLIDVESRARKPFWLLTDLGKKEMIRLRTIKNSQEHLGAN
ncbi:DUF4062 domain-containing protein [Serratia proteamaculans]|uniref:DUF4062 domain-containing protein n=1 Tax=Serratia proteamaculans TaxID=28151 RepID=UPI001C5A2C2A|nr:DUF4062 domain-containing protein [Serratia proteamaculans]WEO87442.1 DUF4062 domain-containing protein [Serratia proteamaculans]